MLKMIQKDLNLFVVYKNSASKGVGSSTKSIVICVVLFVLIVGVTYGTIFFLNYNLQAQIRQTKNNLNVPSVVENQKKLVKESNINQLMLRYKAALSTAKKNFDTSRFIDSELVAKISSSIPDDVIFNSLSITPQSVAISGTCANALSPSVMSQALNAKGLFKSVTFDAIAFDKSKSKYSFNMKCEFQEVAAK